LRPTGPYIPQAFKTPFAQKPEWKNMPKRKCYRQCKKRCKNYFTNDAKRRIEDEPGYAEQKGKNRVKCTAGTVQVASSSPIM
jgi:hypothetical protein